MGAPCSAMLTSCASCIRTLARCVPYRSIWNTTGNRRRHACRRSRSGGGAHATPVYGRHSGRVSGAGLGSSFTELQCEPLVAGAGALADQRLSRGGRHLRRYHEPVPHRFGPPPARHGAVVRLHEPRAPPGDRPGERRRPLCAASGGGGDRPRRDSGTGADPPGTAPVLPGGRTRLAHGTVCGAGAGAGPGRGNRSSAGQHAVHPVGRQRQCGGHPPGAFPPRSGDGGHRGAQREDAVESGAGLGRWDASAQFFRRCLPSLTSTRVRPEASEDRRGSLETAQTPPAATTSLLDVLRGTAGTLQAASGADIVAIYLFDAATRQYYAPVALGIPESDLTGSLADMQDQLARYDADRSEGKAPQQVRPADYGPTVWLTVSQQPLVVTNAQAELSTSFVRRLKIRSVVGLPLLSGSSLLGIVYLDYLQKPESDHSEAFRPA